MLEADLCHWSREKLENFKVEAYFYRSFGLNITYNGISYDEISNDGISYVEVISYRVFGLLDKF